MNEEKIIIDLNGPEGNAFRLLAMAKDLSYEGGFNWDKIYDEMTSGDYDNLIKIMENYFGDQVIFIGK